METIRIDGERRQVKRLEGVYAEYALIADYNKQEHALYKPCFLRNFNLGGASIQISESFSDPFLIGLYLYDSNSPRPIQTIGRIIWKKEEDRPNSRLKPRYNIGVKFLDIGKDNLQRLDALHSFLDSQKSEIYTITGNFD